MYSHGLPGGTSRRVGLWGASSLMEVKEALGELRPGDSQIKYSFLLLSRLSHRAASAL